MRCAGYLRQHNPEVDGGLHLELTRSGWGTSSESTRSVTAPSSHHLAPDRESVHVGDLPVSTGAIW